jgi:acyl-coenzyme A thioesterase PaaI-like protein
MNSPIPAGFAPHKRKSPVTAPWEPIYAKEDNDQLTLGLWLSGAHTNSRGFAPGGLIAALPDNAMGLSCASRFSPPVSLLTVNLAIDYFGVAKLGQWLACEPYFVRTGKTLCFAGLIVTADEEPCARANATFFVTKRHQKAGAMSDTR